MVVNRDIGLLGGLAAFLIGVGSGGGALAAPFDGDPHLTREHAQTGDATLALRVLSSRNDMVSGGDALVEVSGAAGPITATLNGANITTALRPAGQGALRGLITGLKLGENRLEVRQGGRRAALTVTNWPLSGPIFAGPKEAPFVCMTQNFNLPVTGGTLGPATDANCSAPTRVDYIYRTTGGAFRPWPKTPARPADLAQANVAGAAVPYIVRIETGVIDRSI